MASSRHSAGAHACVLVAAPQDMGHHYATHLLAAPLESPRHAKGVAVLRGLLQGCQLAGSPELITNVCEALQRAVRLMSAEEQVRSSGGGGGTGAGAGGALLLVCCDACTACTPTSLLLDAHACMH